jgi:CoA:oxalate CoA-transferase
VLDWGALVAHAQFRLLHSVQTDERGSGTTFRTTVCPIRVDGHELPSRLGSAAL